MLKSTIILPNLKYKNNGIIFIFKESIGLYVNNKWKELKEVVLNNISLTHNIYINDTRFKVYVIEKECKKGLNINIEYNNDTYFGMSELQRIAKKIEMHILNINTEKYETNNNMETSFDEINMDMTEDYSESYNSEEEYQYDDNEYNTELCDIK